MNKIKRYKYCIRMFVIFVVLSNFIVLVSCESVNDRRLIKRAEMTVQDDPTKALSLLDSVKYYPHLTKKYKNLARFVRMFAYYKLDKDIDDFFGAPKLAKYYVSVNDANKASWVYFFSGKIEQKKQNYKDATIYLSEAIEYGEIVNDSSLLLNVYCTKGELYSQQYDKQAAIHAYKKALTYNNLSGEGYWISYNIGNCYLYTKEYRKAMQAYGMAEKEAITWESSGEISQLLYNIGQSYHQISDHDNALKYFRKSLNHTLDKEELQYSCYIAMANEYLTANRDSVLYYLNKIKVSELTNFEIKQNYYLLKSRLEESKGNYRNALDLYKEGVAFADSLWMKNTDERIDNIMLHYEKRKLIGKNIRMAHKQTKLYIGLGILILLVAVIILFFKNLIRKKQLEYIEACSMVEALRHLNDEQERHQDKFRTLLMDKLEVSKKLALLSGQPLEKNKSFLEMYRKVIGEKDIELDWPELYFAMNFLYHDFQVKIADKFPELSEKEIQLCCLMRAGFKSDEIAFVIQLTIYSVQKRKTNIRKKLGLDDREDILEYLIKNIE